jgi:hypothetical protein
MGSYPVRGLVTFPKYPGTVRIRHFHCLLDVALTNDLRYESKDSRDMVKASFSLIIFLWAEDWLEWGDLCQKLFFSGGEG